MSEEAGDNGGRPAGRLVRIVEDTLGLAAGAILFLLMTLTVADVVGRYALNAPLPAGYELVQVGMALLVFLVVPVVTARDEDIRVDIFRRLFPARIRPALRLASKAISLVVILGFAWLLWQRAGTFRVSGETTSNLRMPLAPLAAFVALSWAASAAIVVTQLVRWRKETER
jgi:TRAP-type C4-dicarboxylate transport system permease small subunit